MCHVHLNGQVYDFYSYIIVPYCSKGTVIDLIMTAYKRRTPLSEELCLYLFKQLLQAIGFLHDVNELAHLDVKPDNIVVADDYSLSLIDFGHSNWNSANLSHVVGTDSYMPPEVRMVR